MRIGLLLYGGFATLSGGTLYDRMVVEGLRRLGHEVVVVPIPDGPYLKRLGHGLSLGLAPRLLAGGFDLLLEDELCHPSLFLVNQRLKRLGGPPVVAIVHHLLAAEPRCPWVNRLLALAERRYLASVDGFVFNSQTTRHQVEAMVAGERPQVVAYPAGDRLGPLPSLAAIDERASRPGPLRLLFVGSLIPRKGLLQLLRALAGVERGIWRLTVAGDPTVAPAYARQARELVDRLGLAAAVRFLGSCRDEELAGLFDSHHLFCMPYAYEGFGIAILEAMAFGLPAVGCRHGAAGETINPGENGFLLDSDDCRGLHDLLQGLHHDRPRLTTMSRSALATFVSRPRWQEAAVGVDRFIRGLAGRNDQRPRRLSSSTPGQGAKAVNVVDLRSPQP